MHYLRRQIERRQDHYLHAERHLWLALQGEISVRYRFRRHHLIGGYLVDMVCLPGRLIVEIDDGRVKAAPSYHSARAAVLEQLGYRLRRFQSEEVLLREQRVLTEIWRELGREKRMPRLVSM